MIFAEATKLDLFHLQLVLNYPDGHKDLPVTVNTMSEAERLVYFHNRVYVADTLTHWLNQRINVFKHVGDRRNHLAEALRDQVIKHRQTSLQQLCMIIAATDGKYHEVAPGSKSKFYPAYERLIIPILDFCRKGVQDAY